tara:strand:+ start:837 stop:1037 length:201 start_codon:yes stop_codon:yes gene_type:complete
MKKNKNKYFKLIDKIEKVRSKNNVNWMDVLRLAFKNSPKEAQKLIGKINKQDSKISNLLKKLSKIK